MADEFLKKDWNVVGTVRAGSTQTKLHVLADQHPGRPNLVNVLLNEQGNRGLEYLDYLGRTVPW